ncbi:MAG TPA: hypothetical protein VMU74_11030 [Gaiellaceae bacterium]|nr:hypothetical protein [Gaiellaceae bacterium]
MTRGGIALLVMLALAGCGGSAKPPAVAKPPRLPHALGQTLATQANAVAQALEAGDGCTALADATGLQNAVAQAIAAHEIPLRLQPTLSATVDALPGRITCHPGPPPNHGPKPPKGPKDHGKHGPGGDNNQ